MVKLASYTKKVIADPASLSEKDVDEALTLILHGSDVPDVQIGGFLVAARATGRDHSPDFIATTVRHLRDESKKFQTLTDDKYTDIVGTGGDGQNTFNVSTTAAIIAAGTGLVRVAKHGGPASTSTSGASDLLSHLGVDLTKVNAETAPQLLADNTFNYMSGPVFHPILARVKSVRKELGVPTIFNLVGPLLNPAPIRARVLGVYVPSLGRTYAEAASRLFPGTPALVVCGDEGLDEISPAGPSHIWHLAEDGSITESLISPLDFGLDCHPLSEVASGSPAENAALVHKLVSNKLPKGDPIRDYVLINTAALLVVNGVASSWKHGVELADRSIESGGAAAALAHFVKDTASL